MLLTAAKHFERLLGLRCIVTGCEGVTRHHIVGGSVQARLGVRGSKKHSDWLALPLIPELHQGRLGIHTIGVDEWEAEYGTQVELIDQLGRQLGLDLWELARKEAADERTSRRAKPIKKRSRPYSPPAKQVPRVTLRREAA